MWTMSALNDFRDQTFGDNSYDTTTSAKIKSAKAIDRRFTAEDVVVKQEKVDITSAPTNAGQPPVPSVLQTLMPVSELQELCAKNGLKNPEYRLTRTEGNSHSPFFTIECLLSGVVIGEGIAKTKKGAKHSAAQKGLEFIKQQSLEVRTDISADFTQLRIIESDKCDSGIDSGASTADKSEVQKTFDGSDGSRLTAQSNAVSVLQEFCAKNGFQTPVYSELKRDGACHEPVFWIKCQIVFGSEPIVGNASGKTKQSAKRASAEEVLKMLQQREYPLFPVNTVQKKKSRHNSQQILDPNVEEKKETKEYVEFIEELQCHDLTALFEATDKDYCLRLNLIAEKLNCFANYLTLTESNSKTNTWKCLVQLKRNTALTKRLPVFVSWGNSTVNADEAMQKAAQRAIIMVKVLKM